MVLNFLKSSYQALKGAFRASGSLLGNKLRQLFGNKIDEEQLEDLEALLYEADLGVELCQQLVEGCQKKWQQNPSMNAEDLIAYLKEEIHQVLIEGNFLQEVEKGPSPNIFLIIGVNGSGKTTSIAKIANYAKKAGKEVVLGAADTYRAAATHQLKKWSEESGVSLVMSHEGADPAAVAYDTVQAAISRQVDLALIDTAGRLHNRQDLMEELKKIERVCKKQLEEKQLKVLLVLDAHTGQNSAVQVQSFQKAFPIHGLILTKIDGSAKGGSVAALCKKLKLPLFFLGNGEGLEDLQAFDKQVFVKALFD